MQELDVMDLAIAADKMSIELAERVDRLKRNVDFKAVIIEHYLHDYAAELVHSKALFCNQDKKQQLFIDGQLSGIGHLRQFFDILSTDGITAQASLASNEEERLSILQTEVFE